MKSTESTPASDQEPRSRAAEWIALATAKLAVYKISRGRFTRRDTEYDVRRREFAIGFWLQERDRWRLHKLVVRNALYFEFQIDKEVPFARLTRTTFHSSKLIFYFAKFMRITVGFRKLNISAHRTEVTRSDWTVRRWTFPFKSNPPVPTT